MILGLGQLADRSLELALGPYPVDSANFWTPPEFWDVEDLATEVGDHRCVWTDGSREAYPIAGFLVAGAGVYLPAPELAMQGATWEVAEEYGDARLESCRAFMPVPGPLQTVQRAEFWCTTVALQAYGLGHLGVDNLNAVQSITRLLDHGSLSKPLPLVQDGDLISIARPHVYVVDAQLSLCTDVYSHFCTSTDLDLSCLSL